MTDTPRFLGAGDFVYRSKVVPVMASGSGATLVDEDGYRYVDAEAANGTAGLGFDATLLRAVADRAATLPGLPSFAESRRRIDVGERLARLVEESTGTPGRVAFETGGAQAMELALRVVFANTSARTVVVFEGAYHGRSAATSRLSTSARYRRLLAADIDVVRLPYPDCARCPGSAGPPGGVSCGDECLARVTRVGLDELAGAPVGGGIAAVVFEPLLNVGGMALPAANLVQHVVDHFRGLGALVVVDEVFTGLYRVGPRWGFELHGVVPDVVVGAKAMTNGLGALSFVWAREPLLSPESFPPGSHSTTFAANPFALAAADVVLARYEASGASIAAGARSLHEAAARLRDAPHVTRVDATGWVVRAVLDGPLAPRVREHALTAGRADPVGGWHGVLVASTGLAPDVVALHPPYVATPAELDAAVTLLVRALESA